MLNILSRNLLLKLKFNNIRNVNRFTLVTEPNTINLTPEEQTKILGFLNGISLQNDQGLPRNRHQSILDWKEKNGEFTCVTQLYEVKSIGKKTIIYLFDNILNTNIVLPGKLKRLNNFTQPVFNYIDLEVGESIKSCQSIHIGLDDVAWCRLKVDSGQPTYITDWNIHTFTNRKLTVSDLSNEVLLVDQKIPNADFYIFEGERLQSPVGISTKQVNINIQRSQVTAMLAVLLAKRCVSRYCEPGKLPDLLEISDKNRVFFLRKYLSSKLFNTYVGNEKVSSEEIVKQILRLPYNLEDIRTGERTLEIQKQIIVPDNVRQQYDKCVGYQQEFMRQSLLFGLTFLWICIFRCPNSRNIILGKQT